ncbi:hypothetical protein [Streptomyces sp. NPDC004270]
MTNASSIEELAGDKQGEDHDGRMALADDEMWDWPPSVRCS